MVVRDDVLVEVPRRVEEVAREAGYANELEAIPADRCFRPARRTPWPAIHGVMHARVDATPGSEPYADVDEALEGKERASRFVRMGMHFPLRKGTKVLLPTSTSTPTGRSSWATGWSWTTSWGTRRS